MFGGRFLTPKMGSKTKFEIQKYRYHFFEFEQPLFEIGGMALQTELDATWQLEPTSVQQAQWQFEMLGEWPQWLGHVRDL